MSEERNMATVGIRIGPADQGRKMSLEDFMEAEEEPGYRYELARGVVDVSEIPADDHGMILDKLHEIISLYRQAATGLIRRIAHGSDIQLLIPELESERHPDLAVVFHGAPKNFRGRQIPGLVVEIVSPGSRSRRRDYDEKREEYLRLGIGEYWIVDPSLGQVLVLSRDEADGVAAWSERIFTGEETVESRLLPGFQGRVAEIWADVDVETDESGADFGAT